MLEARLIEMHESYRVKQQIYISKRVITVSAAVSWLPDHTFTARIGEKVLQRRGTAYAALKNAAR